MSAVVHTPPPDALEREALAELDILQRAAAYLHRQLLGRRVPKEREVLVVEEMRSIEWDASQLACALRDYQSMQDARGVR